MVGLLEEVDLMHTEDLAAGKHLIPADPWKVFTADVLIREVQAVHAFGKGGVLEAALAVGDQEHVDRALEEGRGLVDGAGDGGLVVGVREDAEDSRTVPGVAVQGHDLGRRAGARQEPDAKRCAHDQAFFFLGRKATSRDSSVVRKGPPIRSTQ